MTSNQSSIRLCRVVTTPFTLNTLLREQLKQISTTVRCTTVSGHSDQAVLYLPEAVTYRTVSLSGAFSPHIDGIGLLQLIWFFWRQGFHIVHTSTPKAGLVGSLAAYIARVPIRIHTYTGQPWVEITGWQGWLLKRSDWLIGKLTTHCYTDSHSQKAFLIANKIIDPAKISVIGQGSIAGVDLARFDIAKRQDPDFGKTLRATLAIPPDDVVITFIGRVVQDKGINELVAAFAALSATQANVTLLIIGPMQTLQSELPSETQQLFKSHSKIKTLGFTTEPEDYLAISDIFCLPSYREGFGSVVIEAAAMGVPTVGTRVTGLVDAILDQDTGLLVDKKSVDQLHAALLKLVLDPTLRETLGAAAYRRAKAEFSATYVNQLVIEAYQTLWDAYNS